MARAPRGPNRSTLRKRIEALSEAYEPRMKRAFLEAIEDVVSRAELGRIIEALERGDIEAAIRAMHLDPAAFRMLDSTKAQAFEAGGRATVDSMPVLRTPAGDRIVIRFDMRNPRAEQYLFGRSGGLISNAGGLSDRLFAEQVSTLRSAMTNGLQAGRNPRSVALDLIGRMDRATGRRVGGSIGLSNPQQAAVDRARAALLSGDKKAMKQYLTLQRRDRRFDSMVNKAIADGKAVSLEMVDRAIGRYSDRLLQLRGETIARTEIQGALAKSKDEAFRQAVDSGGVTAKQVKKVWIATNDERRRENHWAMNGVRVSLDDPFPNGLMHPHAEGAPAEEVVNCRCDYEHIIDFLEDLDAESEPRRAAFNNPDVSFNGETVRHPKSLIPEGLKPSLAEIDQELPAEVLVAVSKAIALLKRTDSADVYSFAQHAFKLSEEFRGSRKIIAGSSSEMVSSMVLKTARAWRKIPAEVRGPMSFADYAQIRFWSFRGNTWLMEGARANKSATAMAMQSRMAQAVDKWNAGAPANTVYRGVSDDFFDKTAFAKSRPGDVVTLPEITATTEIEKLARGRFGGDTVFVFQKAKGRNIDPLSVYEEREVLLTPGQKWRVERIEENEDGKKIWLSSAQ